MMKKSNPILWMFLLLSVTVFSCQREKLDGERAYLIGQWQWQKTLIFDGTQISAVDSILQDRPVTLVFKEKGVLYMDNNGQKQTVNLQFDYATCSNNSYCDYSINNGKYIMSISLSWGYLQVRDFPYTSINNPEYRNLFKKI